MEGRRVDGSEQTAGETRGAAPCREPVCLSARGARRGGGGGAPAVAITRYNAPGAVAPGDLTPMLHRAAKLWSRRIEGIRTLGGAYPSYPHAKPGADGRIEIHFLVGYDHSGSRTACATFGSAGAWDPGEAGRLGLRDPHWRHPAQGSRWRSRVRCRAPGQGPLVASAAEGPPRLPDRAVSLARRATHHPIGYRPGIRGRARPDLDPRR